MSTYWINVGKLKGGARMWTVHDDRTPLGGCQRRMFSNLVIDAPSRGARAVDARCGCPFDDLRILLVCVPDAHEVVNAQTGTLYLKANAFHYGPIPPSDEHRAEHATD